jgi:protein involved in polysaccharide export with SLBB domain
MKWKILFVVLFAVLVSRTGSAQYFQTDPMQMDPAQAEQMQQQETQQFYPSMDAAPYAPPVFPGFSFPGQTPSLQTPGVPRIQTPILMQTPPERRPLQLPLPVEKPSEFEQYVSEKIEITESQFEILKKDGGIAYSQTYPVVPEGKIAVPVKIVRTPEKAQAQPGIPPEIGVGFLTGTPDAIAGAFRLLGIRSRYAITTELKHFGYDLFRFPPGGFAAVDKFPVGHEYILGPGDEVRIAVWGKIDGRFHLTVDRDGMLNLPKAGVVGVAGLSFQEAKEVIRNEYSKYFSGFEMNVSMGALRTITVYVVGNARRPGAYTISSLSTIVNALFAAGGPSKAGSMRDIQVKRNGRETVHFDMYDLLLKGDKGNDIRLMPEDVVFIPPIGPVAAIAGSVNQPALYEVKSETTISQLIDLAGGLNAVAFKGRIQVERIVENTRQTVFESDLEKIEEEDVSLQSGDIVKVYQVIPDRRVVRVSGAVQREGEYGFTPGMTVKDLLLLTGGPKYYTNRKEAELTRVTVTDQGPKTEKITLNLEKALYGEADHNLPLRENDYLFVRTVPEWKLYQTVTISGEVRYPGTYTIRKGEKLPSLIDRAGGFTDRAYLKGAVFTRERVRELQQKQLDEMVDRLEREMASKGALALATASSSEDARIKQSEIQQMKEFLEKVRQARAKGRLVVPIADIERKKGPSRDIELEEGDSLFIPANPQSIQVSGSVFNQTAFVYDGDKNISDYISLAGGYTENADKRRVYILKVDGTAVRPEGGISSVFWSRDSDRWESGGRRMDPGDTIVVPEKLERIAWLREIKDITQILYQIAVTAGVLIVAF